MTNSLSSKQAGIMCFFSVLANKIIFLPSLIYQKADIGALLTIILCFSIDILSLILIYRFFKNNKDNVSFIEILKKKLGKILTKIILLIFFAFFFIKLIFLLNECFVMLRDGLSRSCLSFVFSYNINSRKCFHFGSLCAKGRTFELLFYPILILLSVTIIFGIISPDYEFPMVCLDRGFVSIFTEVFKKWMWFGDYLFLLFIGHRIIIDKAFKKNLFKFSALGILSVFLVYFGFFGLFQVTSNSQNFAIYDLSGFISRNTSLGRMEVIPIIFVMFVSIIQASIFFRSAFECFGTIIKDKMKIVTMVLINIFIITFVYKILDSIEKTIDFMENYFNYVAIFLFVFTLAIFIRIKKKQKEKTYEKSF